MRRIAAPPAAILLAAALLVALALAATPPPATAAPITVTVFDPVDTTDHDGWQVVSFTGANAGFQPPQPPPYDAIRDDGSAPANTSGQAALCARADCHAGGTGPWPGYDAAAVRWVLRKEVTAPRDDMAVVDATGFLADGAARVRVNGVDAGLYTQWNQPATNASAEVPVRAGANVVEIEVRDSHGANWVSGQLDLTFTDAPRLRKQFVPDTVPLGGGTTLVFTIENVAGAPAQQDWSFTDHLPDGLKVASESVQTDCPGTTVGLVLDGDEIAVRGDLAAGQAQCTISVQLRATLAGTFENAADDLTDVVGIVPPDPAQLTCAEPAAPPTGEADGVFVECPFSDLPPPTAFSIQQAWRTAGDTTPAYQTPLVGDLYGTGDPVVVVGGIRDLTGGNPQTNRLGRDLNIHDGDDGTLIDTIRTPYYSWSGLAPMVLADVDGDGRGEIIFKVTSIASETGAIDGTPVVGRLIAYGYDEATDEWEVRWVSDQRYDYEQSRGGHGINVADFNGDGAPEVYVGNQIFNARTGARLAAAGSDRPSGCHAAYPPCYIGSTVAANMDADPALELAAGNAVYDVTIANPDGEAGNAIALQRAADPTVAAVRDGFTAVADVDVDGDPDVVVSGAGALYVWDGQTDDVLGTVTGLGSLTGAPLVGDIDGDERPEIVLVTTSRLRAYGLSPGRGLSQEWILTTNDGSGQTSLAMFDFNNDGRQELVYRDQALLRIVDGTASPTSPDRNLATFRCESGTHAEMPVIADIDGSGEARILVACGPGGALRAPLHAFESAGEPWANTRPVWNQQSYFVAHVNDDLTVPARQFEHWTVFSDPDQRCSDGANRPLNAFQQQVTDLDAETGCPVVCVAPSLEIEKSSDPPSGTIVHPGETLTYTVAIENTSSNPVPDVEVTDDLSQLLDDATLTAGPTVSPPDAGTAAVVGDRIVFAGTIPEDVTVTVTYALTVRPATQLGDGALANVVAGPYSDCPGDAACATQHQVAALHLDKAADPSEAKLGEQVAYTFTVRNTGPLPVTGVAIEDPLEGLGAPVCERTDLGPGEATRCTASYTVAERDVAAGWIRNTATATGQDPSGRRLVSAPDDALVTVPPLPADLRIAKEADSGRAVVGDRIVFTIRVRNDGPGRAPDVRVRETPSSGRLVDARPSRGRCTGALPLICDLGDMEPGDSAQIRLVLEATEPGTLLNRARVESPPPPPDPVPAPRRQVPDPDRRDNVAVTRTKVVKPKLQLAKRVAQRTIVAGRTTTFTLRVRNPSRRAVRHVRVCDRMPAGLVVVRAAPRPRLSDGRHCWRVERLGPRRARTFRLTVRALPGMGGAAANRATAASPDARGDRASATVRVVAGSVLGGGVTG